MKSTGPCVFFAAICAALLTTSCAIPGVVSSATMGKAGLAIGGAAAGAATGLIDLNDGKIAGVVPVEKLAPEMRKIGVPEFVIAQVEEHARIAKLRGALSSNDVLEVTYLLKSTRQVVDPSDVGMEFAVRGQREARLPGVPDIGVQTRITAATSAQSARPVTATIVTNPATLIPPPPQTVTPVIGVRRTYLAELHVIALSGPAATLFSGLSATAEIGITASAETWANGIGAATVDAEILSTSPEIPGATTARVMGLPAKLIDGKVLVDGTEQGVHYTVTGYSADVGWSNVTLGALATASTGSWSLWATNAEANGTARLTSTADVLGEVMSTNAPATNVVTGTGDDLDITGAMLLGTHAKVRVDKARVTRQLNKANAGSSAVSLGFEPLNWATETGKNGKAIDGRVWLFWIEGGKVLGGHFDWHGLHQTSKGLENVYGGYLSGNQPARGATVWFALSDMDAHERTNVRKSETPWGGK